MEHTLIRYIRNKKGQPRGVVVALRDKNEVCYGYSICNPIDPWNKHKGLKIAVARALAREYELPKAENTIKQIMEGYDNLSKRAVKYFKDIPKELVEFDNIEIIRE
jgi:hypothetical protein